MPKHPLGVYQNRPTGTDEVGQKGKINEYN